MKKQNMQIVGNVSFPKSQKLNVNMMPFIYGDNNTIPTKMKQYIPMIEACNLEKELLGKTCYLTITENDSKPNQSHRRGGIHVESQPNLAWGGGTWGCGKFDKGRKEGIYIASSVTNTTRIWNEEATDIAEGGSLDHKAQVYDQKEATDLKAGQLAWMTDKTPHASLPIPKPTHRQFFRLVTPNIGAWFQNKSTHNPTGVKPDCIIVD